MTFFRNHRGYYFSNGLVKLVCFYSSPQYSIQMVVPGIFVWTIYKNKHRPVFRSLYAYSLLLPFALVVVAFMYFVVGACAIVATAFSVLENLAAFCLYSALYPVGLLDRNIGIKLTFAHDGVDRLTRIKERILQWWREY